jgi:hypothetical protein
MFKNFILSLAALFAFTAPAFAETHVIGDSIAVGIANSSGIDRTGHHVWRKGGMDTRVILGYVKKFIATGKAKGSTVILSSGASNSTYERKNGEGRNLNTALINQQIRLLKQAGATVYLVGTGSQSSPWIKNRYGWYRVNFAKQNVNTRLAEVARQEGAIFLGPLEKYSPELNRGDGIHPGPQGARKMYRATQK